MAHQMGAIHDGMASSAIKSRLLRSSTSSTAFSSSQAVSHDSSELRQAESAQQSQQRDLREFQIPLPPLEVQKEIVAEIEGYQKVIDGARAVLDNYRPHIPIHPDWPMVELGEICDSSRRYAVHRESRRNGDFRFDSTSHDIAKTEHFVRTDRSSSRRPTRLKVAPKLIRKGDILVAQHWCDLWQDRADSLSDALPTVFAGLILNRLERSRDRVILATYWRLHKRSY